MHREFPGGVYALTFETDDTPRLLAAVEAALTGGVAAVQYRDKSADVARQFEQASELAALCRTFAVPLIINDDVRLADMAGADGVHLGRDDGSLAAARIVLGPDKFIGASCYQDIALARAAVAAALGMVFVVLRAQAVDLLRHLALGKTNQEISRDLAISEHTVKDHLKSIFQIIGVNKRNDIFMKLLNVG